MPSLWKSNNINQAFVFMRLYPVFLIVFGAISDAHSKLGITATLLG